ncbi:MAG: hypothetical protein JNK87_32375 [Bryobacterales bacterium]|nr:hypothetical protein [Bryobacterales bacterium]
MSSLAFRLKTAGMNMGPLANLFYRRKRENTAEDAEARTRFDAVVRSIGTQTLAAGMAAAFRSGRSPLFSELVAQLFDQGSRLDKELTLQLLGLPAEQVNRTSRDAVRRAAEELEMLDTLLIERFSAAYAQRPEWVKTLGAPVLHLVMEKIAEPYK